MAPSRKYLPVQQSRGPASREEGLGVVSAHVHLPTTPLLHPEENGYGGRGRNKEVALHEGV